MSVRNRDYYNGLATKYFEPAPAAMMQPVRPVTPTPAAPQPVEEKKGGGIIDSIFGGIGKAVEASGEFLDLSGKYTARPILGALSKGIASEAVQGTLSKVGVESLSEEDAERIRNADSYTQAWRERAKVKGTEWWEEMIAETVADPTTWISAGGVAAVRAVPWVAKAAKASPAVSKALMQAENIVGLAERAQALPLTAPIVGVKKGIENAPRLVGKGRSTLLEPTAKSNLVESIEGVDTAARNFRSAGGKTIGAAGPGEFGFKSTGIDEIVGSNRIKSGQQTADLLRPVGPIFSPYMNVKLGRMGKSELADLYDAVPLDDPIRPFVEMTMRNKGILRTSTTTPPAGTGFTNSTVNTVDRNAVDRSRQAAARLRNTPGTFMATPQVTGNADVDLDNVMNFTRQAAGGAAPQEAFVRSNIATMLSRNTDRANAAALFANTDTREDLIRAVSAVSENDARTHLASAFMRVNAKESARGLMHPWTVTRLLDKFIPQIEKTKDDVILPAYNRYAINNAVVSDKEIKALAQMQADSGVQRAQVRWEKDRADIGTIFENTPGVSALTDDVTAKDIDDVFHLFSPTDQKKVDAFRKSWNLHPDTFEASAKSLKNRLARVPGGRAIDSYSLGDAWTDVMVEEWAKSTAKSMGIEGAKVDPNLLGKLAWVPKAWREQALMSPRYFAVNALDMGVKSSIYGVNAIQNRGARKTATKLGLSSLPRAVFVGNETMDLSQVSQLVSNPAEFLSVGSKSALPGPLGALSKVNRGVSRGMENSFREWAWDNGLKDTLHQFKPMLHQQIQTLVPRADALIADLEQMGTYAKAGGKKVNIGRDQGVLFSPENLHQLATKHGASPDVANQLSRAWGDAVNQGSARGVEMSNKVHFDFDKTYNIEDKLFLTKWMPFHFFATRNIPFYMETLANRPELVNAWQAYQDVSEQDRIEMGLPDRFEGMIPIGDGFLDAILGPNKVFFNPMAALSFADQTKNIGTGTRENEFEEPAKLLSRKGIGNVLERASKLGVGGPAPWVQIPLSIIGVTSKGAKDETMPILRHSGLTEEFLGTDLGEGVARGAINEARSMFHNGERVETQTGSQYRDNQIVTKLQENMQTMIDKGLDPTAVREMFVQASKDGEQNPLWKQAAEMVRSENKQRNVRNFFFPLPTKDASEMSLRTNAARESMPEGSLDNDKIVDLLKHFGDPAVSNRGFTRPGLVDRQGERIWKDKQGNQQTTEQYQEEQKMMWGGSTWGPEKKFPYNNAIAFEEYQKYKQSQPEATPTDFFKAFNIQR